MTDDRVLYDIVATAITAIVSLWALEAFRRVLQRRRSGMDLRWPLAAAFGARFAAALFFSATSSLSGLRGPDEKLFTAQAHGLADGTTSFSFPTGFPSDLHAWIMGGQFELLGNTGDFPLRVVQIAMGVAAIALVAAAVYDLAGPRAGLVVAWVLAFEPNHVFFSQILHKESLLLLAEGLTILGAARMYTKRDAPAAACLVAGPVLAVGGRPYVGAALGLAALLVTVHAALRKMGSAGERAPALLGAVAVAVVVAAIAAPSPSKALDSLQNSQDANANAQSNLTLEPVDFSSPATVAQNLPGRVVDLTLRPYPWQLGSTNQRFGVVGTLVAWLLVAVALIALFRRPRVTVPRLVPLIYVLLCMAAAYGLSIGNAGTGFRYRTHLLVVLVALAAGAVLYRQTDSRTAAEPRPQREPASARFASV